MNYADEKFDSGDSQLKSISYDGETLCVRLDVYELDEEVDLFVRTQVVRVLASDVGRICHLQSVELRDVMGVNENDFYIPSTDFRFMMQEVRKGYFLAYGKRSRDFRYLFEVVNVLSCLIERLEDVSWEIVRAPNTTPPETSAR